MSQYETFRVEKAGIIATSLKGYNTKGHASRTSVPGMLHFYGLSPTLFMVASKVGDLIASQHWRELKIDPKSREGKDLAWDIRSDSYEVRLKASRMLKRLSAQAKHGNVVPFRELRDTPFTRMLRRGTPWLTGRDNRKLMQVYMDLVGEAFALLFNDDGQFARPDQVPAMWMPILPTDVKEVPQPGSDKQIFKVRTSGSSEDYEYHKILWAKSADPASPYARGLGVAASLGDEIEIGEYSSRHIKDFYRNDATPGILITSPDMTEPQATRNESRWLSALRGIGKRFLPYFMRLPSDGKVHQLSSSFREQNVTEIQAATRDRILHTFGISPEVFGILTASNRATTTEARQIVSEGVIIPRNEMWRELYQARLLDRAGETVVDYEDPTPQDAALASRAARTFSWAANIDEQRESLGLDPKEDGSGVFHAVPQNNRIVSSLKEIVDEPPGPVANPAPAANISNQSFDEDDDDD